MGRCRRDVASSPCLRFSSPEVFAQRLLQPVASCIFFRHMASPAASLVAVIRHRGPVSNASRLTLSLSGYAVTVRIYRVPLADNRRSASPAATSLILRLAPWFFEIFHPSRTLAAGPHDAAREFAGQVGNRIGLQLSRCGLLPAGQADFGRFGCPAGCPCACASGGLVARIGPPVGGQFRPILLSGHAAVAQW
jgi:hypothetical protein